MRRCWLCRGLPVFLQLSETFCDAHAEVAVAAAVHIAEVNFVFDDDVSHFVNECNERSRIHFGCEHGFFGEFVNRFLFSLRGFFRGFRFFRTFFFCGGNDVHRFCKSANRNERGFRFFACRRAPGKSGGVYGSVKQCFEFVIEL